MFPFARQGPGEPFDVLELLGIAAALIAAALFITHARDLPLLFDALVIAGAVGPFVLRRWRRARRRRAARP